VRASPKIDKNRENSMKNRFENEAPKKKASRFHFLSILVDLDPFSGGQNRRKRVPERDPKRSFFFGREKNGKKRKVFSDSD
jgi:hypothetical protein